jgi:signal transduction histidine kinase
MPATVLLPAAACLTSAVCAGFMVAREAPRSTARLIGVIYVGTAWWALCEVAVVLAQDRGTALAWMRASAPGWIFLGPLVLHLFATVAEETGRRTRRLLLALYAVSGALWLCSALGPTLIAGAVRTPWGWGQVPGPAFPAYFAASLVGATAAFPLLARRLRAASSSSERRQRPWIVAGVATPICVASLTDAILPMLGLHVPRLGSSSIACLGALGVWIVHRFGHSLFSPGSFADEILAVLPEGVAVLRGDGRIRSANAGLARLAGRSCAELEALELTALLEPPAPELAAGREGSAQLRQPAGAPIPVEIACSALRDRLDHELGLVVVVRDLREVEALRGRLVMAARMAAVGELAAGIAHEINNPIAFVRSNLSQLRGHWKTLRGEIESLERAAALRDLVVDGDALIEESLEGVDRAAEIVRGVRGFSHAGTGERVPTDLNRLLDDVLHMMSSRLRGRATLECNYVDLPRVRCAPQELKQVFLNLLVNAEQAVAEGGRIRVATSRGRDTVSVLVEDDGCGIAPEHRARVFDPFFTTKPVGIGTGLGLGIAYRIVKGHGGEIRLDSEPGRGTRVRVRLPADDAEGRAS